MVGGQAIDLAAAGAAGSREGGAAFGLDRLREMHAMKTGALIRASAVSGAIMAGGTQAAVDAVAEYAAALGLAFQIVDDLLDVEGATEDLREDGRQGRGGRQAHLPRARRPGAVARDGRPGARGVPARAGARGHRVGPAARDRRVGGGKEELTT